MKHRLTRRAALAVLLLLPGLFALRGDLKASSGAAVGSTDSLPVLKVLRGFKSPITSLSVGGGGTLVAAASQLDGGAGIKIWNAKTGRLVWTIRWNLSEVVALSPDGRFLAAGGVLDVVGLWDLRTGKLVRRLQPGDIQTLQFSPDGKLLAGGPGNTRVWDVRTGTLRWSRRLGQAIGEGGLAFSPDGRTLAVGRAEDNLAGVVLQAGVVLVDAQTGVVRRTLGDLPTYVVAYAPDGALLAGAGLVKQVVLVGFSELWDLRTGKGRQGPDVGRDPMVFSRDSKVLVLSGQDPDDPQHDRILFWDIVASKPRLTVTTGYLADPLALTPDGSTLVAGRYPVGRDREADIVLWDVRKVLGTGK